jgi:2-amino-4-hydroxy-6-hydroxymethyldihydropteridine diphosphokinase
MRYFLSLGSNLGNTRSYLAKALAALGEAGVKIVRSSSLYFTQPVGHAAQPWFCNQVVEVSTDLEPAGLLALIKAVEKKLGRRAAGRNRPRVIDIDILMAGEKVVATKRLTIPHPRMAERNFVLVPLLEVAPAAIHPVLKETVACLYEKSRDRSAVIRMPARPGRSTSKEPQQS